MRGLAGLVQMLVVAAHAALMPLSCEDVGALLVNTSCSGVGTVLPWLTNLIRLMLAVALSHISGVVYNTLTSSAIVGSSAGPTSGTDCMTIVLTLSRRSGVYSNCPVFTMSLTTSNAVRAERIVGIAADLTRAMERAMYSPYPCATIPQCVPDMIMYFGHVS